MLTVAIVLKLQNGETSKVLQKMMKFLELQKYYGCTKEYLLGLEETISADNASINNVTGLLDEAINGLKTLKQQIEEYSHCKKCETPDNCNNCKYDMLKSIDLMYEGGFSYTDVISHIIGDVNLWEIILYEAERVMAWHISDDYRYRFEEILNEYGDGSGNKLPSKIEIKEISKINISNAISKSFNEYISKKLKELKVDELTISEHEMKFVTKFRNNKKSF